MSQDWTEEQIASFVDGELDPAEAARIADILERDPVAKRLADDIADSNALLREAFSDIAEQPIPPALAATLAPKAAEPPTEISAPEESNVLPFRQRLTRPRTWIPTAAAASVLVAVGLTVGLQTDGDFGGGDTNGLIAQISPGAVAETSALHAALETLPSGTAHPEKITPMLTFTDAAGRYCRVFETLGSAASSLTLGIACRNEDASWHVEALVEAPTPEAANGDAFTAASGATADMLDAQLESLGASAPLSPVSERAALDSGWQD